MKKFILSDVKPSEVSLVDEGAIKKKFIIFKNKDGQSKFEEGGTKSMKIEEAIELGLIDAEEAKRIVKENPDNKDDKSNVIKDLLASISKMLKGEKVEPVEKLTDEEKKKKEEEDKKKELEKQADMNKLKEQVEKLTKEIADSKKGQELIAKLSSITDPKEYLATLKEIRELNKKEPEPKDAQERIVKVLDSLEKRLESIELKSKGINGQETTEAKKSSWGGAFK